MVQLPTMSWTREVEAALSQRPRLACGERMFLVCARWARSFPSCASRGLVPFLDNSALVGKSGALRERLVEGFEFVAVHEHAWNAIAHGCGGAPAIARLVVDSGKGPELDLYPVHISLAHEGKSDQLLVSKALPLAKLREEVQAFLEGTGALPRGAEIRLKGGLYGDDFSEIRCDEGEGGMVRVGDSPWCDEKYHMRVVVEVAREDGSWPSEDARRGRRKTSSGKRPRQEGVSPGGAPAGGVAGCGLGLENDRKRRGSREGKWEQSGNGKWVDGEMGREAVASKGKVAKDGLLRKEMGNEGTSRNVGNQIPSPVVGVCGLSNLGNSCYANAILQCLNQTQQFVKWFIDESKVQELASIYTQRLKSKKGTGQKPMFVAFAEIVRLLWCSQHSVLSPGGFIATFKRNAQHFADWRQHDAHEFLIFLLDTLHEETNRVVVAVPEKTQGNLGDEEMLVYDSMERDEISSPGGFSVELDQSWAQRAHEAWRQNVSLADSFVLDLFRGQYESRLQCEACGFVSSTFEAFVVLSIPVLFFDSGDSLSPRSLEDCLRSFSLAEVLDASEQWYCPRCSEYRNVSKKITLIGQRMPRILVIHFKRFNSANQKIQNVVHFPRENLDLGAVAVSRRGPGFLGSEFMEEDSMMFGEEESDVPLLYDLFGVTRHVGTTLESGHYVAQVLCSDQMWRVMDDSSVYVLSNPPDGADPDAYILFYKRKDLF